MSEHPSWINDPFVTDDGKPAIHHLVPIGVPGWLDDERATIVASFTDQPHRACICAWEKTGEKHGEGRYWRMTERKRGCIVHGAKGEH